MEIKPSVIIGLVISLLLMGILIPLAVTDLEAFTSTNTSLQTIVTTVIPIVAVIGLLMYLIPKKDD